MPYLIKNSEAASCVNIWEKITGNLVTGSFTILGIVCGASLAYLFAIKQKKKEIQLGLQKTRYERKLMALEKCWQLLAYTGDTENPKTILLWEKENGGNKKYYLDIENAKGFMEVLPGFFYGSGLGLYLSGEIKQNLFSYRGIIHKFLLKEKDNQEAKIEIKNKDLPKSLVMLHQELILKVKSETEISNILEKKK